MRRAAALAVAVAALAGCGGQGGHASSAASSRPPAAGTKALTPEQLAGQHVVFPFAGLTPPRALLARIRRGEAAGVIFLGSNLGTPAHGMPPRDRCMASRSVPVERPEAWTVKGMSSASAVS